ncbi:MAG: tetratricopeptide repeat protein [Victivallales bacterium]|nr:tetratricopeptide repeat protein [Victivallales bacterium]
MRNIIYLFIILNCFSGVYAQNPANTDPLKERVEALAQMPPGKQRDQSYFKLAEQCFQQGKYESAEKLLNEFVSTAEQNRQNAEYRLKAAGMLEYLMRYGPRNIRKTLNQARKLQVGQPSLKETLNSCLVFIGRAQDWKKRSVPQWNELADTVLKTLDKLNDNGSGVTASQITLLKVKILELQGNYRQAMVILEECIRHYYPGLLGRFYRFTAGDMTPRRLLTALGRQYAALADRARQKTEKTQLYSQAAGCYIKAVSGLKSGNIEVVNVRADVLECQEALQLLGYKLHLPKNLQAATGGSPHLLKQMIEQQRYQAALKAIEIQLKKHRAKPDPGMLCLYAETLAGNKMYVKALAAYRQAAKLKPEDKFLRRDILTAANAFHKAGADNEARELFALFVRIAPDHPDTEQALFQCADISMHQKKYQTAAEYFKRCAAKTEDIQLKAKALFNAAQSEYQLGKYESVLAVTKEAEALEKSLPSTLVRDFTLLNAQSLLKLAQACTTSGKAELGSRALAEFQKLIKLSNLPPELMERVILMASFSAIAAKKADIAMKLLEQYLDHHFREPSALEIANHLLELYFQHQKYASIRKLAGNLILDDPYSPKKRELVLNAGKTFLSKSMPEKTLEVYADFVQKNKFDERFLLQISKVLLQDEFDQLRGRADELLVRIFTANLPAVPADSLSGEIYYQLANACFRQKNYRTALELIDSMLERKKVYDYFKVKMLHAGIMRKDKKYASAIKDCQDLLLAEPPPELRREIILDLADSYRQSGNNKKAIATAWTMVPLTPKKFSPDEKEQIRQTLKLIYSCGREINSQTDQKEAADIFKSLFPNDTLTE